MSIPNAKKLRKNQTDAEKKLWSKLRNKQLEGFKFRRQVPIGSFVADFVCYEGKVIIEVDGGQHASQTNQDEKRTRWFESQGYRVIRFWNNEVLSNFEGVLEVILKNLK